MKTNINRKYFETRRCQMQAYFDVVLPLLQDLAKYLCPNTVRFIAEDANKTLVRNKTIIDSTPIIAVRNFASGLITGATSPADNWFKLKFDDKRFSDIHEVKVWVDNTSELIRSILNASNFYQNLFKAYKQLGVFQFACLYIESDYNNVVNFKLLPIGSYRIDRNEQGKIDTVCRVFMMSAKNIVNEYGKENLPENIVLAAENSPLKQFELCHFVAPNPDYVENSPVSVEKKYISVTYLPHNNEHEFIKKSGFSRFPFIFFEAETNGEDIYPVEGCGVYALPDVKQLFEMIRDKAIAVKKMYKPPMKGPASLKNKKLSDDPSAFIEEDENGRGLSPVYEVSPAILELRNDIEQMKDIIKAHFYNDLFAMILNTAERGRTATEVNELKEEKLVLLSPLLEQIHLSLKQIIEWIFYECFDVGILPDVPEIVQGQDLKVEFISTLAQAQKVKRISAMERFTTFVINLSSSLQDPILSKKINADKIIDDYAEFANINASQLVPTKKVNEYREQFAKAQAQKEKQEQAMQLMNGLAQGSKIVSNMGGTDSFGGELLDKMGVG